MRLSILIPTLTNRSFFLERLGKCLSPQLNDSVEVLIERDSGERSIGSKRNSLLEKAKGEYIAFVDDDDLISCDYISLILQATSSKPDCVGIHLLHIEDTVLKGFTYHSIRYNSWFDTIDTTTGYKRYYRNPNHINPVKRELALECKFPEISMGEDKVYSKNILPLLKTEEYVVEPIYYYLYRTNK